MRTMKTGDMTDWKGKAASKDTEKHAKKDKGRRKNDKKNIFMRLKN